MKQRSVLRDERGFGIPQPQLLLIVFVVAVLAAVGAYFLIMARNMEVSTEEGLNDLRSAIYEYHDEVGSYPPDLESLTLDHKYLEEIPEARIPRKHGFTNRVLLGKDPSDIDDEGGWIYFNNPSVPAHWGSVQVNCTHTDSTGKVWSSY